MNGRGAQRASGRTACLVRRHAADSCDKRDVPAEPTNDATRERSTRSEQGSEQDGANDTRANANTRTRSTRKRRHTCDLSRGTATTEPFQTSTSRRVSSSRSSRRSKPSCRPATSPSHYSLSLSLPSLLFSFHLIARRSFFSLPFTVPRFLSFSIVTLISVILVVLLFAGSFVRSFILSLVPLVSSFALSLRSANSTSFLTLVSTIHPQVNIEDSFFGRKVVGITDYPTANTTSIGDVWSKRGRLFRAH